MTARGPDTLSQDGKWSREGKQEERTYKWGQVLVSCRERSTFYKTTTRIGKLALCSVLKAVLYCTTDVPHRSLGW